MSRPVSICVIGSGCVGIVAAVCFAEMGHPVACADNGEARVKLLQDGGAPILERHLPEMPASMGSGALTARSSEPMAFV